LLVGCGCRALTAWFDPPSHASCFKDRTVPRNGHMGMLGKNALFYARLYIDVIARQIAH
jgi:hypothetical protein